MDFVVRESPQSILAENYRQISTNLLKALSDDVGGVIGIFSAMPESGVTTIISNLASSVKVVGKGVLVIDTNFRKPGVARMFGVSEDAPGLSDVLAGNAEFNNVIQTSAFGIDVINAGQGRMIELLNTSKMSEVMDMARENMTSLSSILLQLVLQLKRLSLRIESTPRSCCPRDARPARSYHSTCWTTFSAKR